MTTKELAELIYKLRYYRHTLLTTAEANFLLELIEKSWKKRESK